MNFDEAKTIIGILVAVFPRHIEPSKTLINVWQGVLSEWSFDEVHKALKAFLSTDAEFPPLPGQIHQTILKSRAKPASQVWAEVLKLAGQSLSLSQVKERLENERALRAIEAIGWDRIRYANTEKDLPFIRKDFERMYAENSEHEQQQKIAIGRDEAKQIVQKMKALPGMNFAIGGENDRQAETNH